jgi:uncharacterized membrane protein YjgN (DUF898 family)
MKHYFSFILPAKKLLPFWILFLLCFMAPYMALTASMRNIQPGSGMLPMFFLLFAVLMIIAFILIFYMAKLAIESVYFKEEAMVFNGKFGDYVAVFVLGSFLTLITLGIYGAWFIRDMHRFFVNNSSYKSELLKFRGKGGKLFVILLLTVMLPITLLTVALSMYLIENGTAVPYGMLGGQVAMTFLMIPYLYFFYKWMVAVSYKTYTVSWQTNFWNSCGKIAVEIILSVITLGIYMPLAMLRLYKYFADRTVAVSADRTHTFGYDIDQLNDFLFIWGQTLLTIITLGIYYPWALCKIWNRVLGKTYLLAQAGSDLQAVPEYKTE